MAGSRCHLESLLPTKEVNSIQLETTRAVVYDFFSNGFGRLSHVTGYNVLYGDWGVRWFRDRTQAIMRRNIDMPAGIENAKIVISAFNEEQSLPATWSQ